MLTGWDFKDPGGKIRMWEMEGVRSREHLQLLF